MASLETMVANGMLGLEAVNRLINQANRLGPGYRALSIDLRGVTSTSVAGLHGLALLVAHVLGNADVRILVPSDVGVAIQIDRVGLIRAVDSLLDNAARRTLFPSRRRLHVNYRPQVGPSRGGPLYGRLYPLDSVHDALTALDDARQVLTTFSLSDSLVSSYIEVLSELCDNIRQHSSSQVGGLAGIEVRSVGRRPRILVAVGDLGVGIRASLARGGHPVLSDRTALRRAVERGVSSRKRGNPGRGGGLDRCCTHARSYGYTFAIRSGTALYVQKPSGEGRSSLVPRFRGTQAFFGFLVK